jgi:hypothetical protein
VPRCANPEMAARSAFGAPRCASGCAIGSGHTQRQKQMIPLSFSRTPSTRAVRRGLQQPPSSERRGAYSDQGPTLFNPAASAPDSATDQSRERVRSKAEGEIVVVGVAILRVIVWRSEASNVK